MPGPIRVSAARCRAPLTPRSLCSDDLLSSGFWAASAGECGDNGASEPRGCGDNGASGDNELRGMRGQRGQRAPGTALTPPPAGAVRAPLRGPAEPPARCVCYGLGRFGRCPAARYQLAFLLLLLDELRVSTGSGGSSGPVLCAHAELSPLTPSCPRRCRPLAALCSTRPSRRGRRRRCERWGCACSRRMR